MLDLSFRKQGTRDSTAQPSGPSPVGAPVPPAVGVSPLPSIASAVPSSPPRHRSDIRGIQPAGLDERLVATVAMASVAIVLITGLVASFLVAQNEGEADRRATQVTQLQAQLTSGETGAALTTMQTVSRQLGTYQRFLKEAPPWPSLLAAFGNLVPGSLKLTSAAFSGEKTLRIDGEARDYQAVAQFVAALRESTSFPNPQISSATLNESVDGTNLTFSITTQFVPVTTTSQALTEATTTSSQSVEDNNVD